jgi:hypothetical protein
VLPSWPLVLKTSLVAAFWACLLYSWAYVWQVSGFSIQSLIFSGKKVTQSLISSYSQFFATAKLCTNENP